MRNKNIWIGIALVAAIAVVAVLAAVLPARVAPPAADAPTLGPDVFAESTATADPTTEPTATAEPTAEPTATAKPTTESTATASPTAEPDATEEAAATEAPDAAEETAPVTVTSPSGETTTPAPEESQEPEVTFDPASIKAWLVVTAGGTVYQPIPLVEEGEYSVIQEETGAKNVIHVTTESIDMKSSTCENQDCVKQGVVSLDNMDSRLLGNMIICLPNQVTLELYTTEELIQLLSGT